MVVAACTCTWSIEPIYITPVSYPATVVLHRLLVTYRPNDCHAAGDQSGDQSGGGYGGGDQSGGDQSNY